MSALTIEPHRPVSGYITVVGGEEAWRPPPPSKLPPDCKADQALFETTPQNTNKTKE
jgi:hypothetical protein